MKEKEREDRGVQFCTSLDAKVAFGTNLPRELPADSATLDQRTHTILSQIAFYCQNPGEHRLDFPGKDFDPRYGIEYSPDDWLKGSDERGANSVIESWWRTLKHQWLYLNTLDTVDSLRRLVDQYVEEYNLRLPHSAFQGQTPEEMYRNTGQDVPKALEARRRTPAPTGSR